MMERMDDLVQFLRARLDEDERTARSVLWNGSGNTLEWRLPFSATVEVGEEAFTTDDSAVADHIARHDPARVLAEVEAKRHIIDWHRQPTQDEFEDGTYRTTGCRCYGGWPCPTLRALALPYDRHPDYRDTWRP